MKLLLIEDSERLRASLSEGLRKSGYAVDAAADGEAGLWSAQSNEYDVIILDIMLPKLDGLTLLRRLRQQGNATHVLLLTAKDTVDDRIKGLREGADDYLIKPFAFEELVARVQALCRRAYVRKDPVISCGELKIDTSSRIVTRGDRQIDLTSREYCLLEYLALRGGAVTSRTEIEKHIYDERVEPLSNVVDAAVYALRSKIDVPGEGSMIETRRGMGYVLRTPVDGDLG